MGVGGNGIQAIRYLQQKNKKINLVGIDTDTQAISNSLVEHAVHIGKEVTNGFSAGGDPEVGRQAIEKDSTYVRNLLRPTDLLIIVAGLGGGTGSGALPVITRIAREAHTLVLCLVSMPFKFEGKSIQQKADKALKRLRMHADAIVRLPNHLLVSPKEKNAPAEELLTRGQKLMGDAALTITSILSQDGIYGLDFASLRTMLQNCDGFCHFASTHTEGTDRSQLASYHLLNHPLLNDGNLIKGAPGLIVGLLGGPDLTLEEIESIMRPIHQKLPPETWINIGVIIDPEMKNKLSAMLLVAEQWKEPLVDDSGKKLGFSLGRAQTINQGELPLEMIGKGQFSKSEPTIFHNQDLDVPTYVRKNIKLPR
jgi:cell division protein FtsZ